VRESGIRLIFSGVLMAPGLIKNTEKSPTLQFQETADLIEEEMDDDIAWRRDPACGKTE
jgi:hypothetical protein